MSGRSSRALMVRCLAPVGVMGVAVAGAAGGDVLRVDAGATGANDGTSWADAFVDLQDALGAAQAGDEVWVASGVYTPSATDATASFVLRSGVGLYGGFAGWESSREQRDWRTNETVLSGDIGRDDVIGSGQYWYTTWERNSANCGHVVVGSGVDETAVLDGFTISNGATGPDGTPAGDPLMFGSGLYVVAGCPTVRNCTFLHNLAAFAAGGAVYCLDAGPTFTGCAFLENYVHLGDGAGLHVAGAASPVVEDCTFTYNVVVSGTGDAEGAGLAHWGSEPLTVTRCNFTGNLAKSFYTVGSDLGWGGGVFCFTATITVRDCVFVGNTAHVGGGLITFGQATVVNSVFLANKAVPKPNDPYPEGGGFGAGVMIYSYPAHEMTVADCTIAFNTGKKHVGVLGGWNGKVNLRNSIVWGNVASHPDFHGYYREQIAGSFKAEWSCIQNIFGLSEVGGDPLEPEKIPGCIDGDPRFVDGSDLHLAPGSPCIDAGKNALVPAGVESDLDGLARFADDPASEDTGVAGAGHAEVVDMGAFEVQAPDCAADFNGDGAVNTLDVLAFLNAYSAHDPRADFNGDGVVNTLDFIAFLNAFVAGCP
ncbi:MAG TPA: GC-type dockerin domain-anchored protein [Phycisphaerales bacterium]|nr:GC-type dockerin domain-anchored protein [Phycisphaerales bacterium]